MRVILVCLLSCFASAAHAQRPDKKLDFCYWRYDDTASARKAFGKQTAFFQLKNNDTIVDIGSSSGGLDGALASFMDVTGVHFILVDIDSNCLNPTKVKNMQTYYAQVKGAPLAATFSMVNNTTDSLYLPLNRYRKDTLMNPIEVRKIVNPLMMARFVKQ